MSPQEAKLELQRHAVRLMYTQTTDNLTEDDWRGVQRLLFAVEDQLEKADDVICEFEQMTARAATMIPAGPDREEFERHFRSLCQPLVELELRCRNDFQI